MATPSHRPHLPTYDGILGWVGLGCVVGDMQQPMMFVMFFGGPHHPILYMFLLILTLILVGASLLALHTRNFHLHLVSGF